MVYTDLAAIGDQPIAIVNTAAGKAVVGSDAQNIKFDTYEKTLISTVAVLQFKLELVEGANYRLRCVTPAGGDYGLWGNNPCYLNGQPNPSGVTFNLGKDQDVANGSTWTITKVADGFTLQNVGNGGYLGGSQTVADAVVWQLASIKEVEKQNPIAKPAYNGTGYVDLTGSIVGTQDGEGRYTGHVKVSLTQCDKYRYVVVTLAQNTMEAHGGKLTLTDVDGRVIQGDDYGVGYQNMWFGSWNHQYTCGMDLEMLRENKWLNVNDNIELDIDCGTGYIINHVYASNVEAKTVNRWGNPNDEGTYRNVADGLQAGTYGTVCLPYAAAYAGATVYEVSAINNGVLELSKVGMMEAGKPYIYQVNECLNTTNADAKCRAFFYQASEATVASPVAGGELVGVLSNTDITEGYVLQKQADKFGFFKVTDTKTVPANHAYIAADSNVKAIYFDAEATAIEAVNALTAGKAQIFDLNGRQINKLQKGINIVNGVKILVK